MVPRAPSEPGNAEPDAIARRAFLALGVAAIGVGAFVVALREALKRAPPERPAAERRAEDRAGVADSAAAAVRAYRPSRRPPGEPQPVDVPRLH